MILVYSTTIYICKYKQLSPNWVIALQFILRNEGKSSIFQKRVEDDQKTEKKKKKRKTEKKQQYTKHTKIGIFFYHF